MSFQIDLTSEQVFKTEITDVPATLQVVEVYQSWCGPCKAAQSTLKKLFFDLNDRPIKFFTAAADKLPSMREYLGKCIPVFLLYKDGQLVGKVVGVKAPELNKLVVELSAPKAASSA